MDYLLYKKNIPILLYEEDDSKYIVRIKKIFNLEHLPPHLFTNGAPSEEDLLKIMLIDFIIANEDRHSFNISFLRNSDNLQWIGLAPVYDSGKSMFLNKLDFEMDMTSSNFIPSKPFEETQYKQFMSLPMEKIYNSVDFGKLDGILGWYKEFLAPSHRDARASKARGRRQNQADWLEQDRLVGDCIVNHLIHQAHS